MGFPSSMSMNERTVDVDPLTVYFTFSRIRPCFSCGRTIEETLQQLRKGELRPRDLPLLSVLTDGVHYYSQNNRRLYAYKQLRREGLLDTVPVRLRPLPHTKRMQSKYTPESCSLTATLMREPSSTLCARSADAASIAVPPGKEVSYDEEDLDAPQTQAKVCASSPAASERAPELSREARQTSFSPASPIPQATSSRAPCIGGQAERSRKEDEKAMEGEGGEEGCGEMQLLSTGQGKHQQPQRRRKQQRRQQQTAPAPQGCDAQIPGGHRRNKPAVRLLMSSDNDSEHGRENSLEAELRKLGLLE